MVFFSHFYFYLVTYILFCSSQRRDNMSRCNLLYDLIAHFGLLKTLIYLSFLLLSLSRAYKSWAIFVNEREEEGITYISWCAHLIQSSSWMIRIIIAYQLQYMPLHYLSCIWYSQETTSEYLIGQHRSQVDINITFFINHVISLV